MKDAPFLNLVLGLILAICTGWLLYVGQGVLLPIFIALIAVYVLNSLTEALQKVPLIGRLPMVLLRVVVLVLFTAVILAFAGVVASTVREISALAPTYQANLEMLFQGLAARFDVEVQEVFDEIREVTLENVSVQSLVLGALGGFTSVGTSVFFVVIYAVFLMAEHGSLTRKVAAGLQDKDTAERTLNILSDIDRKVSDYLAVKTLVNIILGVLSFVILSVLGVDFALFWAILIALLNYIPYVGSYIGVAFPVILALAQFGSLWTALLVLASLTAAQVFVGNFLDPRMVGRQLNLSPFVVLVALSIWGSLWGIPGAILAIPLTSILVIILSSFEATRFLAILLADRVEEQTGKAEA